MLIRADIVRENNIMIFTVSGNPGVWALRLFAILDTRRDHVCRHFRPTTTEIPRDDTIQDPYRGVVKIYNNCCGSPFFLFFVIFLFFFFCPTLLLSPLLLFRISHTRRPSGRFIRTLQFNYNVLLKLLQSARTPQRTFYWYILNTFCH